MWLVVVRSDYLHGFYDTFYREESDAYYLGYSECRKYAKQYLEQFKIPKDKGIGYYVEITDRLLQEIEASDYTGGMLTCYNRNDGKRSIIVSAKESEFMDEVLYEDPSGYDDVKYFLEFIKRFRKTWKMGEVYKITKKFFRAITGDYDPDKEPELNEILETLDNEDWYEHYKLISDRLGLYAQTEPFKYFEKEKPPF